MIDPTESDIGRRVRMHPRRGDDRLGNIVSYDESSVWVRYEYDPTPRKTMRCLLTYVDTRCSKCRHELRVHGFEGHCSAAPCDCIGWVA